MIPVATSRSGLTSHRSKPTMSTRAVRAVNASRSSAYDIPFGSPETQPGINDMSSTSMSMLT